MRTAVWYRTRAELRRQWASTVVLALLVVLAGGVVLASVAGARRTGSAMDRFVEYNRPLDTSVEFDPATFDETAVAELPMVAGTGRGAYVLVVPSRPDGSPDLEDAGGINGFLLFDEVGIDLDRPIVVDGRAPEPDDPLEVAVDEELAEARGVGPGERLRVHTFAPEQLVAASEEGQAAARGPTIDLEVAGVIRTPNDVVPRDAGGQDVIYAGTQEVYFGGAWYERFGERVAMFGPEGGLEVRFRHGDADRAAFEEAVRRLPGGEDVSVSPDDSEAEVARRASHRAIRGGAAALVAFAAVAAVAAAAIVGPALARTLRLGRDEVVALRSVGLGRSALAQVALLRSLVVAAGGGAGAVALAVALSPLFPIGLARRAEIDPGVDVDVPVLALGALVLALVVAACGLASGLRRTRAAARAARPSWLAERLAGSGAPPPVVSGVRLATERGRGWAALGGLGVAALAVVAAGTFADSLDRLTERPDLQGWDWDVVVGNGQEESIEPQGALLEENPLVGGWSGTASPLPVELGGEEVLLLPSGTGEGPGPTVVEGRPPVVDDEVVLGARTLDDLDARLGSRVPALADGGELRELTVVGTAMFNDLDGLVADLGRGAWTTLEGARALGLEAPVESFLVDYAPGADEGDAFRSLREDFGRTVLRPVDAVGVANLERVGALPVVLAALVAVLALAALATALLGTLRQRRRDLAVLRTVGFLRRQLGLTIASYATTTVVLALVVGVPVGVGVGRWAWRLVAESIGTTAGPVVPPVLVALVPVAALLVALAVAALPARAAATTDPAVVLRGE